MRIGLGSDHLGFELKEKLKGYLASRGYEVADYGCHSPEHVDYPDIAFQVAEQVLAGSHPRAVLVCGTGNGMTIAANKVKGIRAALCHDPVSAERAGKSNNAQILCMGALIIDFEKAREVVDLWLASEFQGGPSARKIAKIRQREESGELDTDAPGCC
ncbi:ribose 5-phosphate isomerase B [Paenibacillus sp. YN15]|uniref:ribose 5-phosphate isomerase B n=1 Tax=Paenibacillus sp. YN15 TaxID=1742774 RepID=UPI000DCC4919|nr:ribose 5-phosphate isomerase B [Paenibacillus sp. YN15]RAV01032.1 ribose 5-phosphate isomerase B [Paenibacillus sp. YN15]